MNIRTRILSTISFAAIVISAHHVNADDVAKVAIPIPGAIFDGTDTLHCDDDPQSDAQDCLSGLRWTPSEFEVRCEAPAAERGDLLIRFNSPIDTSDAINDNVSMEWYIARDEMHQPVTARAVVIVHESGSGMTVGRIFAKGLNAQGLHTFLIHLPGYGNRRSEAAKRIEFILTGMKQAIADVRRAKDVVTSLPFVQTDVVGVQGTSLGGFVTATVAGLDQGYGRVFVLLAGGNLADVVMSGNKDAAKVRAQLESAGVTGDEIRRLSLPIEPLRLAHRVDAEKTWLYSGKYDDVVPPASSFAFAEAAKLQDGHHIEMLANHYSGVVYLPVIVQDIRKKMDDPQKVNTPSE
jgi:dienelactone hydrolase